MSSLLSNGARAFYNKTRVNSDDILFAMVCI